MANVCFSILDMSTNTEKESTGVLLEAHTILLVATNVEALKKGTDIMLISRARTNLTKHSICNLFGQPDYVKAISINEEMAIELKFKNNNV